MRKVNVLLGFSVVAILLFSLAHAGVVRVEVCHRPPGKDIWQTITIPEIILSNHLAHGDLAGSCDDNLDILCDDGNPCTVDVDYDNLICLQEKIPVNCDDENPCTNEICDESIGCVYEPVICDDGNLCTLSQCAPDTGECVNVPIVCGIYEECNEDTGTCEVPTVVSAGGRIWMDRNLGASRVATSPTDSLAYGDLYQWGRGTDGHQLRTSETTTTLSSTYDPGHGYFIVVGDFGPGRWMLQHDNSLWQGVSGINNPCPEGFRLPTITEWEIEALSWANNDVEGPFKSPLKLVLAGQRISSNGSFRRVGMFPFYWSSTVGGYGDDNYFAYHFSFYGGDYEVGLDVSASGSSVRCIQD